MRKVIVYKYNIQFQYKQVGKRIEWYTEQNKYLGTTTTDFFEVCELLDNYINNK